MLSIADFSTLLNSGKSAVGPDTDSFAEQSELAMTFKRVLAEIEKLPEEEFEDTDLSALLDRLESESGELLPFLQKNTEQNLLGQENSEELLAFLMANAGKEVVVEEETLIAAKPYNIPFEVPDLESQAADDAETDDASSAPLALSDELNQQVAIASELDIADSGSEVATLNDAAAIEGKLAGSTDELSGITVAANAGSLPSDHPDRLGSTLIEQEQTDELIKPTEIILDQSEHLGNKNSNPQEIALAVDESEPVEIDGEDFAIQQQLSPSEKPQQENNLTKARAIQADSPLLKTIDDAEKLKPMGEIGIEDESDEADMKVKAELTVNSAEKPKAEQLFAKISKAELSEAENTQLRDAGNIKPASEELETKSLAALDLRLNHGQGGSKANLEVSSQLVAEQIQRPMKLSSAGEALAERIIAMSVGKLQQAFIRLDPPELGSIEVKIQLQQEQAQVQIVSSSTQVRDALEQQSARLRDALASQGFNLENLDVSDQSSYSERRQQGGEHEAMGESMEPDELVESNARVQASIGMVDHYV